MISQVGQAFVEVITGSLGGAQIGQAYLEVLVQNSTPSIDAATGQAFIEVLAQNSTPHVFSQLGQAFVEVVARMSQPPTSRLRMGAFTVVAPDVITTENKVWLRWSDDRGCSWGNPVDQTLGDVGQFDTDVTWYRLGQSRDRVFEISWTAPQPESLMGLYIVFTYARS